MGQLLVRPAGARRPPPEVVQRLQQGSQALASPAVKAAAGPGRHPGSNSAADFVRMIDSEHLEVGPGGQGRGRQVD